MKLADKDNRQFAMTSDGGMLFFMPASAKESYHLYKRGDMPGFRSALQREAEHGDLQSQAVLGEIYLRAFHVERDLPRADSLLSDPAEHGLPHAIYELACVRLLQARFPEARSLLQQSARQQFLPAVADLGRAYEYGIGGPAQFQSAIDCYQTAARLGHTWARMFLGEMVVRNSTAWPMTFFGRRMKTVGKWLGYWRTLRAGGTTEQTHVFLANITLQYVVQVLGRSAAQLETGGT